MMLRRSISLTVAAVVSIASIVFGGTPANSQIAEGWNITGHQNAETANAAGMMFLGKRQTSAAIQAFRKAIAADPQDPNPYLSLALALASKGQLQEALDALQKSYSTRPTYEALLSTGIVYYLMHDYDAAINAWNKVLVTNPKLCNVYGDIGMATMRKGNLQAASDAFRKLVQCHPNSQIGYYGLGLTKMLQGDFKVARSAAERANEIGSYPPITLLLAELDALQGDRSRAKRLAQQYNLAARHAFPQRTMTEIGFPMQHDFQWDPFLADNFDNGYLLMARMQDAKSVSNQRYLAKMGKAPQVIASIKAELATAPHDFFLLRQLAITQMADGDFSSATESFQESANSCKLCHSNMLWMALALARDGKDAAGSSTVRDFEMVAPGQQISPLFKTIGTVDPALQRTTQPPKRRQPEQPMQPARQMQPAQQPMQDSHILTIPQPQPQTAPASSF